MDFFAHKIEKSSTQSKQQQQKAHHILEYTKL
jgi:hypothetical protein